jgi:uncharacterized membrane protein
MTFSDTGGRLDQASTGLRVTCALLAGAVVGVVASLLTVPSASILLGWDVAVAIYLGWTWSAVRRLDPGVTARLAKREDPSVAAAEFLLIGAGIAALGAVAFALVKAGQAAGGMKAYLISVGLLSVVLSWAVVHTVFMLRYARAYYAEPAGGIEFNEKEPPTWAICKNCGPKCQIGDLVTGGAACPG